jgi:hypothetical protein
MYSNLLKTGQISCTIHFDSLLQSGAVTSTATEHCVQVDATSRNQHRSTTFECLAAIINGVPCQFKQCYVMAFLMYIILNTLASSMLVCVLRKNPH